MSTALKSLWGVTPLMSEAPASVVARLSNPQIDEEAHFTHCGRHDETACCGRCHRAAGEKKRREPFPLQSASPLISESPLIDILSRHP